MYRTPVVSAQYRSGDVFTQISDHRKPAALTASTHFLDRDTELWTLDTETQHSQHPVIQADTGPYRCLDYSASKRSIQRFVITEKAPTSIVS